MLILILVGLELRTFMSEIIGGQLLTLGGTFTFGTTCVKIKLGLGWNVVTKGLWGIENESKLIALYLNWVVGI